MPGSIYVKDDCRQIAGEVSQLVAIDTKDGEVRVIGGNFQLRLPFDRLDWIVEVEFREAFRSAFCPDIGEERQQALPTHAVGHLDTDAVW